MQLALATYYAVTTRIPFERDLPKRQFQIRRTWEKNFSVCGADTVWAQLQCGELSVNRGVVERPMGDLGRRGARQSKTPHYHG